ncbi:MAG: hypothetical protein ABI606_05690 [Rhodoferax sp.]
MQYRSFGNSKLHVSTLCLGAMMFCDQTGLFDAVPSLPMAHAHA